MSAILEPARAEISELLRRGFHSVVFQPICALGDGKVYGFEGLMRGPAGTLLAEPGSVFKADALDRGLLHDLDLACILSAVRLGRLFAPEHTLFINMHGETLLRSATSREELMTLAASLQIDLKRVVLEVSEMTDRSHVRAIGRSLRQLRRDGVRIALDDIGARYAWLHHMLWLEPEFIKLDRQFVRGIHLSRRKQNLVRSIALFARESGSRLVVEGVEIEAERVVLIDAGVEFGQGYLLGRPSAAHSWFPTDNEMFQRARVAGLME